MRSLSHNLRACSVGLKIGRFTIPRGNGMSRLLRPVHRSKMFISQQPMACGSTPGFFRPGKILRAHHSPHSFATATAAMSVTVPASARCSSGSASMRSYSIIAVTAAAKDGRPRKALIRMPRPRIAGCAHAVLRYKISLRSANHWAVPSPPNSLCAKPWAASCCKARSRASRMSARNASRGCPCAGCTASNTRR